MMRPCKCRACGWFKGSSRDICANPACDRKPVQTMRTRQHRAISATTKHGFHAPMVRRAYALA